MATKPADKEIIDHKDLRYKRNVSDKWRKHMDKQAYEHTVGLVLSKQAEDLNAPAMVGNFVDTRVPPSRRPENEYARQLKENVMKARGSLRSKDGSPARIPGYLENFYDYPPQPGRVPITLGALIARRKNQAGATAYDLFDENTVQYRDAKEYLKARGAENHQRYKDGTLWKNEPSKVPMPKTISQPDKIKQLEVMGAGMANARIPGYSKNNIVG